MFFLHPLISNFIIIGAGDELEAARLAESETWTSQELDRSTPDLLHAGPDVISHGPIDDQVRSLEKEDQQWHTTRQGNEILFF